MSELILKDFDISNICGEECKYQDSYMLIEQEVDKDYSVTQDETNWLFVYEQSQELLETKTKDLKLIAWWIFSHFKNNSFNNFDKKLNTFILFLDRFSEDLYPKSKKGKSNIINWLEESLTNEILNNEINKQNLINPVVFYEVFMTLNDSLKSFLQDENNRFRKIIDFLRPFYEEEQRKLEESKISENEEKSVQTKSNLSVDAVDEVLNDNEATKLLSNTKRNLSVLASFYRKKDFKDLKALRITRFLSWLETDGLPYADGKVTSLYPPAELELDELNTLFAEEKYDEALFLAEEILEVSPFWINGHLMVHNIFEKTNEKNISDEVKNSIVSFVKTNSGILDFYFSDNTPFASSRVKKWLEEDLSENSNENRNNQISEENEKLIETIETMAQGGNVKGAMNEIAKQYDDSASIEEKFNWRLYHAQLAVEFNKKDIALALLDDLQKTINRFNLDEWNPKLASKVYTLILNSFTNIDIENERLEDIYKRLCKTDINSAFEIKLN